MRGIIAVMLVTIGAAGLEAQQADASARLRRELPPAVADPLEPLVRQAQADGLPADALVSRALEGRAKGVPEDRIVRAVSAYATQLEASKRAVAAGGRAPSAGEIEAGALALGLGAREADVSALARQAPSGRSLTVPLAVMGSLIARGLPSDAALGRVQASLMERQTDRELMGLPGGGPPAGVTPGGPPPWAGPGATASPPAGPPAGVPGNAGGVDPGQRGPPEGVPRGRP